MKRYFSLQLLIISCMVASLSTQLRADSYSDDVTSHTFFSVRPQYRNGSPERLAGFRDRAGAKEDGYQGAAEITFFGGRSTQSDDLARFFFPFDKTELVVASPASTSFQDGTHDVFAPYFGVWYNNAATGISQLVNFNVTPPVNDLASSLAQQAFQSEISICPRQSTWGIGLAYRQEFCEGWFFDVSAPVVHVKNDLRFDEKIIGDELNAETIAEGSVGNVTAALTGKTVFGDQVFKYGKVSECPLKKTRLADIEFVVGYTTRNEGSCNYHWYAGFVAPTGNKPTGEFVFEPIVGNNKHFGVLFGTGLNFEVWNCDNATLSVAVDNNWRYLFRNTQRRSFDLVDKQWSRYMWVYENVDELITDAALGALATDGFGNSVTPSDSFAKIQPGINFFTQDMRVNPGYAATYNTALLYNNECGLSGELGYNFFARVAEKVELCAVPNVAIAGLDFVGANNGLTRIATQSHASIIFFGEDIANDTLIGSSSDLRRVSVKASDINLKSAAHPCVLTHTFYGALNYAWDVCDYPMLVGAGASYEFSKNNTGLNRWTVWGKAGVSF